MSLYLVLVILEFFPARLATLPHGLDANITQLLANLLTKPSVVYYLLIVFCNLVSINYYYYYYYYYDYYSWAVCWILYNTPSSMSWVVSGFHLVPFCTFYILHHMLCYPPNMYNITTSYIILRMDNNLCL